MAESITREPFERLQAGEEPSPARLAAAPRIEQWQLRPHRVGKTWVIRAEGLVYGHPEPHLYDGIDMRTSALVWVDRRLRFVLTQNRIYVLGQHAGDAVPIDGIDA